MTLYMALCRFWTKFEHLECEIHKNGINLQPLLSQSHDAAGQASPGNANRFQKALLPCG